MERFDGVERETGDSDDDSNLEGESSTQYKV